MQFGRMQAKSISTVRLGTLCSSLANTVTYMVTLTLSCLTDMFNRSLAAAGGACFDFAGVVLSAACVAAGRAMSPSSLVHAVLRVEQLMTAGTVRVAGPTGALRVFWRINGEVLTRVASRMGGRTDGAQLHIAIP